VFTGGTLPAGLVIGSKVDVNGMVVEFDFNPMAGDKVTEIQNVTVTVLADAPIVPVPFVADPAIVGDITNGEPFEGVFVSVSTLKVTNPALGNGKIELTANGGAKVVLDDDLFTIPAQTMNACLNVIGVMHVQLNDDIRTLLPRSAADITAGAGCL
jgi:hypothetical protein